jgi:hypothetical protein
VISTTSSTATLGISETDYSLSDSYYEFVPVYCTGITINVTIAQELHDSPDQEKYVYRVVATSEVNDESGTFIGWPRLGDQRDFGSINTRVLSGKNKIQKREATLLTTVNFENNNQQNDISLFEHLRYRETDFLFYPSGGEQSEDFFRFSSTLYKLRDLYQVQIANASMSRYTDNIYSNPVNMFMTLRETI